MKITKNEIKEIIENEIVVDCYGDEEVSLGWAVYMEENIFYPFEAEYKVKWKNKKSSWKKIIVINNETSQSNLTGEYYYVEIEFNEIVFTVKLNELKNVSADDETLKTIEIWNHRKNY